MRKAFLSAIGGFLHGVMNIKALRAFFKRRPMMLLFYGTLIKRMIFNQREYPRI